MDHVPDETGNQETPYAGKGCPKCGYDLTGTLEPRCPECGVAFDPAKLRPVGRWKRLRFRVVIPCVLLAMYLPNTWVFWIDYPWNEYRMLWIKHYAILPAFTPTIWLLSLLTGKRDDLNYVWNMLVLVLVSLAIIGVSIHLGRRSWRWLIPICVLLFAFEIFNAYISHALFRM